MKLFCLTYAGGSAAFYADLEKQLAGCINFVKFEYSGHGNRYGEKFYSSMDELADDAYNCLKDTISDNDENDELVKARTIEFGAIPEKLISNRSFWRMYLPIYKADYIIIGKYSFENISLETEVPATVLYSKKDTPLDKIEGWSRHFVNECQFVEFVGNHFFITDNLERVAEVIREALHEE